MNQNPSNKKFTKNTLYYLWSNCLMKISHLQFWVSAWRFNRKEIKESSISMTSELFRKGRKQFLFRTYLRYQRLTSAEIFPTCFVWYIGGHTFQYNISNRVLNYKKFFFIEIIQHIQEYKSIIKFFRFTFWIAEQCAIFRFICRCFHFEYHLFFILPGISICIMSYPFFHKVILEYNNLNSPHLKLEQLKKMLKCKRRKSIAWQIFLMFLIRISS